MPENKISITALQKDILRIVDQNSGGIKFMELIPLILKPDQRITPDALEAEIRDCPELDILEYAMQLMDDLKRIKMFVYRPLKSV